MTRLLLIPILCLGCIEPLDGPIGLSQISNPPPSQVDTSIVEIDQSVDGSSIDAELTDSLPDIQEPMADLGRDRSAPDIRLIDGSLPDAALPDAIRPDMAIPDVALPDMAIPDVALPDMAIPDVARPDMAIPDAAILIDSDLDGIFDHIEQDLGTDPFNPDSDNDGLRDGDEIEQGTNPLNPDSDQDGINDGDEVNAGLDPLDPNSTCARHWQNHCTNKRAILILGCLGLPGCIARAEQVYIACIALCR